jgi:acyl carrier protein
MSDDLTARVKKCIISRLNLEVAPEAIDDDAPIFQASGTQPVPGSLGLDSIDALELVVALSNEFGVTIGDEDMAIFQSVNTITDFIRQHAPPS